MLRQDVLIRDLAAKYKKDPRVIEAIVYSPFKFIKKVMSDPMDNRSIRIQYFGVFTQKNNTNKDTRFEKIVNDLEKDIGITSIVMAALLHFPITNVESAKRIITEAKESKDYEKIRMIWDALQEYSGK